MSIEENKDECYVATNYGFCRYALQNTGKYILYNLYVEPEYRRKGHARAILQYAINEIKRTGYIGIIEIEAKPRDESISLKSLITFYTKMGLTVIQSR